MTQFIQRHQPKLIAAVALAILNTFVGFKANAYHDDYYTIETVRRCENQNRNTVLGAVGGAITGGVLGAVFGNGRALPTVAGAAGGGLVGGLLGSGLSCNEETTYVKQVDDYLYHAPVSGYRNQRVNVVLLGSGYDRSGNVCRTYHSDYYTPRGWVAQESTACWRNGRWWHGYDAQVITRREYRNHSPRFYVDVEDRIRDRQRMFWAGDREREEWARIRKHDRIMWARERAIRDQERRWRHEQNRQDARELVDDIQWQRHMDRVEARRERMREYEERRRDRREYYGVYR